MVGNAFGFPDLVCLTGKLSQGCVVWHFSNQVTSLVVKSLRSPPKLVFFFACCGVWGVWRKCFSALKEQTVWAEAGEVNQSGGQFMLAAIDLRL